MTMKSIDYYKTVAEHYDMLVDENNDPVRDCTELREYMDKWDGKKFLDCLELDPGKNVLEIGVGTGRIAVRTAPLCKSLTGIDVSAKTVKRAKENLSGLNNVSLICGNFLTYAFSERFDVIYSTLTFVHIKEKIEALNKIFQILNSDGIFVLSIDKNQEEIIDYGTRKIKIYPDCKADVRKNMENAGFYIKEIINKEFSFIFKAVK